MKISHDEPILKFLFKSDFVHSSRIFHYGNVTYYYLEKDPHAIIYFLMNNMM